MIILLVVPARLATQAGGIDSWLLKRLQIRAQPGLLYFLTYFYPLSVIGCRLSDVVVECLLYLSVVVVCCLLLVVGCRLLSADCELSVVGCRWLLLVSGCRVSDVGCWLLFCLCRWCFVFPFSVSSNEYKPIGLLFTIFFSSIFSRFKAFRLPLYAGLSATVQYTVLLVAVHCYLLYLLFFLLCLHFYSLVFLIYPSLDPPPPTRPNQIKPSWWYGGGGGGGGRNALPSQIQVGRLLSSNHRILALACTKRFQPLMVYKQISDLARLC